jgi:hypothetical protein
MPYHWTMRKALACVLFVALSTNVALAQAILPAGKPAGVYRAQHDNYAVIGVGAGVLILITGLILASGTYTIPSTAPTSTQP